jgi:hypothetical protein
MTRWWKGEKPPTYYSFSPDTGEFVGSGPCDPSPLEPGIWLVPGSATRIAPATGAKAKQIHVWTGEEWVVREDHRSEVTWLDGEFRTVTSIGSLDELGLEPMVVHDAEYYLPEGSTDPAGAMIHMWINDDEIGFVDDPNLIARQVLAAWEAQGETIRPIQFDDSTFEAPEPEPEATSPEEIEARRLEQLRADMDKLAQQGVEGIPVPQEERS